MRETKQPNDELDTILDDIVAASDGEFCYDILDQFIHTYPQYSHELTEFAVAWCLMDNLPAPANKRQRAATRKEQD